MITFIGYFALQPQLVWVERVHPTLPEIWSNLSATINFEGPKGPFKRSNNVGPTSYNIVGCTLDNVGRLCLNDPRTDPTMLDQHLTTNELWDT